MWVQDIKEAQKLEEKLAAILKKNYGKEVILSSKIHGAKTSFTQWDLKIEDEDLTIELKYDRQASYTKNVAIEFRRWVKGEWRYTGISTTQASVWVQYFNNTFYFIETETLKSMW